MNEDLELARRHVDEARRRIDRQRQLIAEMRARGQDTALAEDLLDNLLETSHQMELHRDMLEREARGG